LFLCDPFASVLRLIEEATVGLARCEDGKGVTRLRSRKSPSAFRADLENG
jgi:hypothetical protein